MRVSTALAAVAAALLFVPAAHAGTPTFAPKATYQTGTGIGPGPAPQTIAVADFDGDGDQDVATVSEFGQASSVLLLNDGAGHFGAAQSIAGTQGAQSLVTGDVNGDGKADLVGMTPNSVLILLGDGHGHFGTPRTYSITLGGQIEAILGDLNNDGKLDIIAPTFNAVQTLLGNGDGTFRSGPRTTIPNTYAISAVATAHLNSDAYQDLYAVDGATGSVYGLKGTGTGAFTVGGHVTSGFIPEDVGAVRLNGDAFDDVAVIGSFSFSLGTALADGNGGFGTSLTTEFQYAGEGPTSLGVADLDGDGRQDLISSDVANPADPALLIFGGNGTVHPAQVARLSVDAFPQNPAIADLNGDGKLDIAVAGTGTLTVLINTTP